MAAHFSKYQALGNDYLVLHENDQCPVPSPAALRAMCDRHSGQGSDGVLVETEGLVVSEGGAESVGAGPALRSFGLRIFNPDGSEAEKSGNGLRIFARHIFETRPEHPRRFAITTKGGLAAVAILADDGSLVRVDMGRPEFDLGGETLDREATFGGQSVLMSLVSMGNPHCVLRGLPVDEATARRVGPIVEGDHLFPSKTNVQLLEIVARDEIRIEIWERGAGYTLSSGSSSCAAAAVARRLGLVGEALRVRCPGGVLRVEFVDERAFLTGPVEKVCEGDFAPEFLRKCGLPC